MKSSLQGGAQVVAANAGDALWNSLVATTHARLIVKSKVRPS